jgi:hypothetical protein
MMNECDDDFLERVQYRQENNKMNDWSSVGQINGRSLNRSPRWIMRPISTNLAQSSASTRETRPTIS